MTRLGMIISTVLLIGIGGAVAAELTPITGAWRYKMTVDIETPEGIKTGSAVREVNVTLEPRPEYKRYPYHSIVKVKGEAVVVDLGKRGVVFALLGEDYAYQIVFKAFPGPPGLTPDGISYYSKISKKKAVLEPGPLPNPLLAYFKNPNDPKTVTKLMPDNLSHVFGANVKIKDITIEITDEPITNKINRYLPSYDKGTGFMEWFRKLPYGDPNRIGPNNFKSGEV